MFVADLQDIHFIVSLKMYGSSHAKADLLLRPTTVSVLRDAIKWTLVDVRKCKLIAIVRTMTAI